MEALRILKEEANRKRKALQETVATKVCTTRTVYVSLLLLVHTACITTLGQEVSEASRLRGVGDAREDGGRAGEGGCGGGEWSWCGSEPHNPNTRG